VHNIIIRTTTATKTTKMTNFRSVFMFSIVFFSWCSALSRRLASARARLPLRVQVKTLSRNEVQSTLLHWVETVFGSAELRPQETDRLLLHMGIRWRSVAYVVEDAAILSRELEATTSTRVRREAMGATVAPLTGGGKGGHIGAGLSEAAKLLRAMVGMPVARWP
jgi:hypothetical protein